MGNLITVTNTIDTYGVQGAYRPEYGYVICGWGVSVLYWLCAGGSFELNCEEGGPGQRIILTEGRKLWVQKGKGFQIAAHLVMIIPYHLQCGSIFADDCASLTEEKHCLFTVILPAEKLICQLIFGLFASSNVSEGLWDFHNWFNNETIMNLTLTTLFLYPLSRKDLPGRNIIAFICFLPCCLMEGLIPSYISVDTDLPYPKYAGGASGA